LRDGLSSADLRAALWAHRTLRRARRELAAGRVNDIVLEPPPELPASARRGVEAVLRRRKRTCLEAALVRQRWLAAHGLPSEIVIGVSTPSEGFIAHAWIDGEEAAAPEQFSELSRIP
jgi:Transglutaminase-like superfamily